MKINPEDPWYPVDRLVDDKSAQSGVPIRLKLAAMAMQGFIATYPGETHAVDRDAIQVWSFGMADAMIDRANRDEGK